MTTSSQSFQLGFNPVNRLYQVAAVCYRRKGENVQFLLVSTNGAKWTFPKGGVDPGMPEKIAAQREALEEAGAIGTIEPECFDRYLYLKQILGVRAYEVVIKAYLMEVHALVTPHEDFRRPTWFGAEEAKRKLTKNREPYYAGELQRIIDHAVKRIKG